MPKLCPKCGTIYKDEDRFCHIDGSKLQDHPVSPPPTGSHPAVKISSDSDKYMGQILLGQFEIFDKCGAGSMGTVYKARQLEIDRIVAIKILHPQLANQPEAILRFHREAKVISNLNHPNIVHIYLFGHLPDGNLYIVQEYVEGRSLASELKKPIEVKRTIHIARQILSAIAEAHASGVIHRDLKPENIMLTWVGDDRDFVKILDFGVAKKIVTQTFATKEGLIFGSPRYISPEAAMGEKVDLRSDLYSLGVILYQMLSGELPFQGETPIELLMAHINTPPTPLRSKPAARDIPPQLENIVMKLLAKNPRDRFPTALTTKEALEEVERILSGKIIKQQSPFEEENQVPARIPTKHSTDTFTEPAKESNKQYQDYTTQEDVMGTQELFAREMRKEKIKKILAVLGVILLIPVATTLAYTGYKFLKKTFFPYDRGVIEEVKKASKSSNNSNQKIEAPSKEAEKKTEEITPPSPPSVDITIENEEIPQVGKEIKLQALVSNETGKISNPHFLIKISAGVEVKVSAIEIPEKHTDKRIFEASYTFSNSGAQTVTFASTEKIYSPSVIIHVGSKGRGDNKTRRNAGKLIDEPKTQGVEETTEKSKQPKIKTNFGPDIDFNGNVKEGEKNEGKIKIIEKSDEEKKSSSDTSWF